jgi:hypothetical protein
VFDTSLPCVVETDASDYAIGAVLNQIGEDKKTLCPIAFFSRKLVPAEVNYDVHDKELLAIVDCFKLWRHCLEDSAHQTIVYTDHSNLQPFMGKKFLNHRQARWALYLSSYNFSIQYRPGSVNSRADALSRRPDFAFNEEGNDKQPVLEVLRPAQTLPSLSLVPAAGSVSISATISLSENQELRSRIISFYQSDPVTTQVLSYLKKPNSIPVKLRSKLNSFQIDAPSKLLLLNNLVYIPNDTKLKLHLLEIFHDSPVSGHLGRAKTFELLSRHFTWPGIRKFVNHYIFNCSTCKRTKPSRQEPVGHLLPLPVPERPWSSISLDFITGLPSSDGYNSILVVVDRLSKMSHFIPCSDTITSKELSFIFLQQIFQIHGLPKEIVADRGPILTSKFWQDFLNRLKINSNLSTTFHPQTDGQTERVNSILEQFLRMYVPR